MTGGGGPWGRDGLLDAVQWAPTTVSPGSGERRAGDVTVTVTQAEPEPHQHADCTRCGGRRLRSRQLPSEARPVLALFPRAHRR